VRRARGLLTVVGLAAAGAIVGLVGAFVQAISVPVGSVDVPVGAIAAVTMTTIAVRAGATLLHHRAGAVAVAVGWAVTVLWMSTFPTNEGDIIIATTTSALVYLYGGVLLASFAIAFPVRATRSGFEANP
jgi:Family of unknown function (DUF6113)